MMDSLQTLINTQRKESFVPEYQAKVTDAEALGILIAHYFDWDGVAILETAVAALEDANFHTESAALTEMAAQLSQS